MSLVDNPILVVQIEDLGGYKVRSLLDRYGVLQNREYIFFDNHGHAFLNQVHQSPPPKSQLILMTYGDGIDSAEVAKKVKEKNPKAIVFGVASVDVSLQRDSYFDGIIVTTNMNENDLAELSREFIEGLPHGELLKMVEGFSVFK